MAKPDVSQITGENRGASIRPLTLVITDLDGTLLDHHSYSYAPALPALHQLEALGIPVIFCSSKTAAEIVPLRQKMANHAPYVCENGAAVAGLDGHDGASAEVLGAEFSLITAFLDRVRAEHHFRFTGFSDMSDQEVVDCTGLSLAEAALAKKRQYSEPLIWQDSEARKSQFLQMVEEAGLQALQGGRFLTVAGNTDKGRAVSWLRDYYQRRYCQQEEGKAVQVIALGDSPNDEAMLAAADIAVIIKSEKSSQIHPESASQIIRTREPGPEGWCAAITSLLKNIDN